MKTNVVLIVCITLIILLSSCITPGPENTYVIKISDSYGLSQEVVLIDTIKADAFRRDNHTYIFSTDRQISHAYEKDHTQIVTVKRIE